jgi:hypothetical protein
LPPIASCGIGLFKAGLVLLVRLRRGRLRHREIEVAMCQLANLVGVPDFRGLRSGTPLLGI